jgi:hypothetical protein
MPPKINYSPLLVMICVPQNALKPVCITGSSDQRFFGFRPAVHNNSEIANGTYNLLDNLNWALLQTKQAYFTLIPYICYQSSIR